MFKSNKGKNNPSIGIAICICSVMLGFALANYKTKPSKIQQSSEFQPDEKFIGVVKDQGDPFKLYDLNIKKIKITPNKIFSSKGLSEFPEGQEEDWLDKLAFTIINISEKKITYIDFELQFPETDVNGPRMVYKLWDMGIPPNPPEDKLRNNKPFALAPDETVTLTLPDKDLQRIKEFIATRGFKLSDIHKVIIQTVVTYFEDDTMYSMGNYYRPNPSAPGKYERIKQ